MSLAATHCTLLCMQEQLGLQLGAAAAATARLPFSKEIQVGSLLPYGLAHKCCLLVSCGPLHFFLNLHLLPCPGTERCTTAWS